MNNWYKKAQLSERSKMVDPDTGQIIFGPEPYNPTYLQKIKNTLERKYPKMNWTVDMIMDFLNKYFLDNPHSTTETAIKDLLHRPLD